VDQLLQPLTQFGVAGLMGLLWVWERHHSRRRDRQLSQTHERLMRQRDLLRVVVRLVRQNTMAIERFHQTQERLNGLLESVRHEIRNRAA
jgi:hypothetical protein